MREGFKGHMKVATVRKSRETILFLLPFASFRVFRGSFFFSSFRGQ